MYPDGWTAFATQHRRTMVLLALVSTFAGVGLIIDRPKGTILEWFAIPLLVIGGAVFAWAGWPRSTSKNYRQGSFGSRLLRRITFQGRLVPLFPALGVGIILMDLVYNLRLSATPNLLTEDVIVLLAAACLLGYGFVPTKWARERDFVLLFFIALNAILVIPLLVARTIYQDYERSVDVYSWIALAPPLSWILSGVGVPNTVHAVAGSTAPGLTFVPQHMGTQATIVITTSCSGIYSFGIFASAFGAFVLTEFEHPTRRVWLFLGIGLLAAYLANVLRMVVIVLVGYYSDTVQTDLQNMLIAHSYAGWLIFLAWVTLFWGLLLKLIPFDRAEESSPIETKQEARRGTRCAICSNVLVPLIPATVCTCGTYLHHECLQSQGQCPSCGKPSRVDHDALAEGL